jgi:chromosome segregation protein
MYLKELSINGFKSFAKKGELEFSAPITAIVGPNGSGKSNIAESFRFVLGEQSVKSLRGKRGEDLIWGGSTSVSRGNRASVVVLLDNTQRVFALDFDEVKIERIVHRDGQNEYLINDSPVRLKDVQELLAAAHIGSTGHHIISQGEADRILSSNAKERREMIEDALGLKVYQYKKQEAERKLEKTRENIAQVESLRREHAPHLKYLKKQVERVEKSLAIQAELKTVYAEYLKREDVYIAYHTDRLQAERLAPVAALEDITRRLEHAKTVLKAAETADSSAVVTTEETLAAVRKERQAMVRGLSQIEGQIAYITRHIESVKNKKTEVTDVPLSSKALEAVLVEIETDISKVGDNNDVITLRQLLRDIAGRLRTFLHEAEPARSVASTESEEQELQRLQAEYAQLHGVYQSLEHDEKNAEAAYTAARAEVEMGRNEIRDAERAMFELVNERRSKEYDIDRIDRELAVLDRDRGEFKQELQEAVALIASAAAHYFSLDIVVDGVSQTTEMIAAEPREKQRERHRDLEKLKIRLEELGLGATDEIVKEYENAVARDEFLGREIADLVSSVEKLEALIAELTAELHEQFIAGIDKIAAEFNTFFTLMFGGGSAGLTLTKQKPKPTEDDSEVVVEDPEAKYHEGVEIEISLPNKRVKGLDMLSGGERALTSIALIFAMSQVNPPPFIILDETDAALDEANSRRYGDMIEALAKKSQLILITHNRETMSRAGILYGITMGSDGVSKLLSVKFEEAAAVAK